MNPHFDKRFLNSYKYREPKHHLPDDSSYIKTKPGCRHNPFPWIGGWGIYWIFLVADHQRSSTKKQRQVE